MKKILFVIVSLVISVSMFGQGKWSETKFEADEFKGTKEYTAYSFENEIGEFVYWSNKNGQYRLISFVGNFNYETGYSQYTGHWCGITVKVGLFDENDKMVDKFDMWLECESGDGPVTTAQTFDKGGFWNPTGQGKKVKKIMKHLNEKKGYVRFFADLYNANDFDFKVQCKNN